MSMNVGRLDRIPANELHLMPATFLIHRADIPQRVRFGHLGKKFFEELRFRYRAVEEFGSRKQYFVKHDVARVPQEIESIFVCFGKL